MPLNINGEEHPYQARQTLLELVQQLHPEAPGGTGIAVALNDTLVHRPTWQQHLLQDGDSIEILRATCGG